MESAINATQVIDPSLWEPTVRSFLGIPVELYRGKEKTKLLANPPYYGIKDDDTFFPKGSRLGCYYRDEESDTELGWRGGILGTVVQAVSSSRWEKEDDLLVTFLEDGLTTWVPSSWCSHQAPKILWEAGPFLYHIWYNSYEEDPQFSEFHHAMQSLSQEFPHASPAFFSYWQGKYPVKADQEILDDMLLEKDWDQVKWAEVEWVAVDPRLTAYAQQEHPSLPVYHTLPRTYTIPVDDKYLLFKLYNADPIAASVFPPTFGSIKEALQSSSDNDSDELFYLKDAGGSQGMGIRVLPRSEMLNEAEPKPGSIVIQKAVHDILTIDVPFGPLFRRRFDIRYFVVVHGGKVYLHSNAYAMWAGVSFNPEDPSVENQVPKLLQYSEAGKERLALRDFLFFPHTSGTSWRTGIAGQHKRTSPPSSLDPVAWREEISISLSKARSTLAPLIKATASDPFSYHLLGGDAIIERSTGRAILMEYNDWPDFCGFPWTKPRENCLLRGICTSRRIVMPQLDSEGSYVVMPPSADKYNVYSGYTAQLIRDTASLVMGLERPESLERFREITEWTEVDERCAAST